MILGIASLAGAPTDAFACRLGIGDRVWYDANRNGIQDNGEPGLNGVTVKISPGYYSNPLDPNSFVDSMVTTSGPGGDGYYLFRPVDCGIDYTISVDLSTIPAGLLATSIGVGSDRAVDSDNPSGTVVNLPNLGFDYSDLTIDFGFVAPACEGAIGDRVWNDANANGIQDTGEGNYSGAVVTLNPGGSLTTDANGNYLFSGLCAGTYKVCVIPPQGTVLSPANQGFNDDVDSDGEVDSDGVCTTVTLPTSNTVNLTNDFGFYQQPTQVGTGTPGYWKNHPEAWPVNSIVIGGVLYSKAGAIANMGDGVGGDKTYTMFMHLVAAKLNVLSGTEAGCIAGTIGLADAWMEANPLGSKVKGSSLAWKNGEPLSTQLDRYNNGMLCAPHRD